MEEPMKIIRKASRLAIEAFAAFVEQETTWRISDEHKKILAENLDHTFYKICQYELKQMIDLWLDEDD